MKFLNGKKTSGKKNKNTKQYPCWVNLWGVLHQFDGDFKHIQTMNHSWPLVNYEQWLLKHDNIKNGDLTINIVRIEHDLTTSKIKFKF